MKSLLSIVLMLVGVTLLHAEKNTPAVNGGEYAIVIDGYDWGPAVSKVILSHEASQTAANFREYSVDARRQTDCVELPEALSAGKRTVVYAYVSDARGNVATEGTHVTLVLAVAPNDPIGSPIQYTRNENCRGNNWIDYSLTVTHTPSGDTWTSETDRIMPGIDRFDLSGKYTRNDVSLTYASYAPESTGEKRPLIIWLHGGGEGGTDPSIALIANKAANYASEEIQALFGGAFVLVPQTPTFWMNNGEGGYTRGDVNDMYNETLMSLIREYVNENPEIDSNRIYVGGCSNGGYMSLKLLLEHPDYFAAGYISALAYHADYISDEQIEKIKDIPIWFVHSKDDSTTVAKETVIPVYERLKAAGATNVYLSLYEHVVDITGFYGGEDYLYPGHWSWIYCHANTCREDADGSLVRLDERPVTIMEWLAAQQN